MRKSLFASRPCSKLGFAVGVAVVIFLSLQPSIAESISQQKKAVVFIFGTIHPLNPDKTAMRAADGSRLAVEAPLGTGFFVDYRDENSGKRFSYLVTAQHVLRDMDGAFLSSVRIRLNLMSPAGGVEFGFIDNIPVSDAQGNLLWLHGEDQAADVVALPFLPDERKYEYAAISTRTFVKDAALLSESITEGEDVYFIGLMAQYYGAKRNYPLVRHGRLALLTDEDIDTPTGQQKIFIAALESWPGNSGSPVFLLRDGANGRAASDEPMFLGIVVASFQNKVTVPLSGGQPQRQLQAGDTANTGLTCIVPATVVEEILKSPPAQQERATGIQ
jgi:hypothetical protein